MKHALTLSIVIPVYNEEGYIKACLDAIAQQTDLPDEVLVIDNNCSDSSMTIAKSYSFVKIVNESRQGQVFAQDCGFAAAKSDILGRIDADSILAPDWVAVVKRQFNASDKIVAVTGRARPFDVAVPWVGAKVFNFYHHIISGLLAGHIMLWGANSAVKKSAWLQVRSQLTFRTDIWEDFDLSFCLAKHGTISYMHDLNISCSFRASHKTIAQQTQYQSRAIKTYKLHKNSFITGVFTACWLSLYLFTPLVLMDRWLAHGQPKA